MRKIKKYIYPLIFFVGFIVFRYTLVSVINAFGTRGGYGGLGLGLLALLAWIVIAIPFYCIRYSKLIVDIKLYYLFAIYNALAIIVGHVLLFISVDTQIIVYFSLWVIFWNVLPLAMRLTSRKNSDKSLKKDDLHLINLLLQNKTKNIIAICITCLYIASMLMNPETWSFYYIQLSYTLPFVSAVIFLVLLFSKNKEYYFKKWLLSFALAGNLLGGLFSVYSNINNFAFQTKHNPMFPVIFTLSCLMVISIAVMFIGSFLNFKYIKLFKYSALSCAVLAVAKLIFNLINMFQTAFELINSNGTFHLNTYYVIYLILPAAYFVGIYILSTNKYPST